LSPKPLEASKSTSSFDFPGNNLINARENGAIALDSYFMNGNTLEGFKASKNKSQTSENALEV
jgi:hypothetical protein